MDAIKTEIAALVRHCCTQAAGDSKYGFYRAERRDNYNMQQGECKDDATRLKPEKKIVGQSRGQNVTARGGVYQYNFEGKED